MSLPASQYPEAPVPWQVMTEAEEAARKFIMAGRNKYLIPYQFGGEPKMTNEVLCMEIGWMSISAVRPPLGTTSGRRRK